MFYEKPLTANFRVKVLWKVKIWRKAEKLAQSKDLAQGRKFARSKDLAQGGKFARSKDFAQCRKFVRSKDFLEKFSQKFVISFKNT